MLMSVLTLLTEDVRCDGRPVHDTCKSKCSHIIYAFLPTPYNTVTKWVELEQSVNLMTVNGVLVTEV